MAESDGQEVKKPTSVANDESKRYRLGKGPAHRVEERAQVCYGYILEGGTRHQIATRIADRFNVSLRTAHDDYKRAMALLREEQQGTREELLNQLQALRLAAVMRAMKKNQWQSVTTLLKDMGAVINEAGVEQQAAAAPQLSITIDDKRGSSPSA